MTSLWPFIFEEWCKCTFPVFIYDSLCCTPRYSRHLYWAVLSKRKKSWTFHLSQLSSLFCFYSFVTSPNVTDYKYIFNITANCLSNLDAYFWTGIMTVIAHCTLFKNKVTNKAGLQTVYQTMVVWHFNLYRLLFSYVFILKC